MNTTTKIQVKVTYVNGWGETATTPIHSFDSIEQLTELLKASGQQIISIEIIK
jgi:hypothetical protein